MQIYSGGGHGDQNWDAHGDVEKNLAIHGPEIDRPIAALITDLKRRGLFDETLIVWGGEFGRTPMVENGDGRNHHPNVFTMWMAGGGVKAGFSYGSTDEVGREAVDDKIHTHDWHATILHLLGLDHKKLTFNYAGRDFRLTDVHGQVVRQILA